MMPIDSTISILVRNVRKWGDYYGLSKGCGDWAKGLGLRKGGRRVLYTGCLYQLVPYIDESAKYIGLLEGHRTLSRLLLRLSSLVRPASVIRPSWNEYESLYGAVSLLKASGVEFGYLYGDDVYCGAHLWDLGLEDEVRRHGELIKGIFERNGVEEVITVDPHTTYMLGEVYPSLVEGFDFEVKTVLELADPRGVKVDSGSWVVHDPCYFSRYKDLTSEFRRLARALGITILEPKRSGRLTTCCGGPVEWFRLGLATEIAKKRMEELLQVGERVLTYCPICLSNLRRAGAKVEDFYALAYRILSK